MTPEERREQLLLQLKLWMERQEAKMLPKTALLWELPGDLSDNPPTLIIRPHDGELLLSISTRSAALITLARRPNTHPSHAQLPAPSDRIPREGDRE